MYSPNSKYFEIPEIAIIRPAKKALPYTVIPIGDREALLAWRKDQALRAEAREAYMKPIREATRARAIAMIENQDADLSLTKEEQDELAYVARRAEAPKPVEAYAPLVFNEDTQKPSLGAKVKEFFASIWKSAFPE